MPDNTVYQQRYCAYVDVPGFSGLIDSLRSDALFFEELRDLLTIIHHPENVSSKTWPSDFRAQSISDAVCISAP